jgi:hypothetical protein
MKRLWLMLPGLLTILAPAGARPGPTELRLHIVAVPPSPEVWWLGKDGRVLLKADPAQASTVILPRPAGGWPQTLRLELSKTGYQPLPVEISGSRPAGQQVLVLPPEGFAFYRLRSIHRTLTILSQPDQAQVFWQHAGGSDYLGPSGTPLDLDLGRMATSQASITFQLKKAGYRAQSLTVGVDELMQKSELGPVSLPALFPGAALLGWLSMHRGLCWAVLIGLGLGSPYLLWRIARSGPKAP